VKKSIWLDTISYIVTAYISIGFPMRWSKQHVRLGGKIFAFSMIEDYWSKVAPKEITPHLDRAVPSGFAAQSQGHHRIRWAGIAVCSKLKDEQRVAMFVTSSKLVPKLKSTLPWRPRTANSRYPRPLSTVSAAFQMTE
jgi:hypothetical protein